MVFDSNGAVYCPDWGYVVLWTTTSYPTIPTSVTDCSWWAVHGARWRARRSSVTSFPRSCLCLLAGESCSLTSERRSRTTKCGQLRKWKVTIWKKWNESRVHFVRKKKTVVKPKPADPVDYLLKSHIKVAAEVPHQHHAASLKGVNNKL